MYDVMVCLSGHEVSIDAGPLRGRCGRLWKVRAIYFVLLKPEHANRLKARIEAFVVSPWVGSDPPHFERAEC